MTRSVRILEATIRDGGYMVDHHFSKTDLATLVGGLDRAGFPFIEVGHGNGVGSQFFKDPKLRATVLPLVDDAAHAEIALRVAQTAKVGVVLTAGKRFAPEDYIDRIADLGYAFVRLAVMPDEVDDALFSYVRRVKARGMLCSINVMQTYVKTPAEIAAGAREAADHGLDWFYVVDSAGGMMADDVKRYVEAVLAAARVEVGLHSHNNLGCAVANAIAAVEAGATLVDGTLNGIGRATGNPATEQLAVALRDRLAHDVDLDALVSLGNAIRSLFADTGNDSFDFISGGALLHSRNVPKVIEAARQRDRSPCSFMLAVGAEARRRGQLNSLAYGDDLYDAVLPAAAALRASDPTPAMVEIASEEILARWHGGATRAIEDVSLLSRQRHVPSVVHVSRAASALCAQPVPWQSSVLGVTVPWAAHYDVAPERLPDYVLLDEDDPETSLAGTIATWRIRFADIYARAVADLRTAVGARAIVVDGDHDASASRGDIVILAGPLERAAALRARGVRVVQPKWPAAVARLAESLVELRGELASDEAELAAGVAVGPVMWDPERAVLLHADDPEAAAKRAATAYVSAIIRGKRRL